jgi:mannose-6-phosphate isomerase-like protein (cupin superfamily)
VTNEDKASSDWRVFDIEALKRMVAGDKPRLHEFLREPSMSMAVYRLPVGCRDMQAPHLEDEVYLVLEGKASLRIDDKEHDVRPGTILYVRATMTHSFFDIQEDLVVLALFGAQV